MNAPVLMTKTMKLLRLVLEEKPSKRLSFPKNIVVKETRENFKTGYDEVDSE